MGGYWGDGELFFRGARQGGVLSRQYGNSNGGFEQKFLL